MGKPRRKHSREFKIEAVRQVVDHGRPVGEVATGLGINANLLTRWKAQFVEEGSVAFSGKTVTKDLEEENKQLRRELVVARQERDILKKAAAYFANAKN